MKETQREKIINYLKIKNFYSSKETTEKRKKQVTRWKKILALPITPWLWIYLIHNTFLNALN